MTAKTLLPNQHDYLHPFYGADNCCLCKAEQRIIELEQKIIEMEKHQELGCGEYERVDAINRST